MPLIIDGYNLLFAAGIVSSLDGHGSFQQDRQLLLDTLCQLIPREEISKTVVVFDASYAPPGLPRTVRHQGMTVHFASNYADADAMIEELILEHTSPRRLTVVSSDHRIQRAARRRKALAVDSDRWFAEQKQLSYQTPQAPSAKPNKKLSGAEVLKWMEEFGDIDLEEIQRHLKTSQQRETSTPPKSTEKKKTPSPKEEKPNDHWEQLAQELGLAGQYDLEELSNPEIGGIFPKEYLDQIAKEFGGDKDA